MSRIPSPELSFIPGDLVFIAPRPKTLRQRDCLPFHDSAWSNVVDIDGELCVDLPALYGYGRKYTPIKTVMQSYSVTMSMAYTPKFEDRDFILFFHDGATDLQNYFVFREKVFIDASNSWVPVADLLALTWRIKAVNKEQTKYAVIDTGQLCSVDDGPHRKIYRQQYYGHVPSVLGSFAEGVTITWLAGDLVEPSRILTNGQAEAVKRGYSFSPIPGGPNIMGYPTEGGSYIIKEKASRGSITAYSITAGVHTNAEKPGTDLLLVNSDGLVLCTRHCKKILPGLLDEVTNILRKEQ